MCWFKFWCTFFVYSTSRPQSSQQKHFATTSVAVDHTFVGSHLPAHLKGSQAVKPHYDDALSRSHIMLTRQELCLPRPEIIARSYTTPAVPTPMCRSSTYFYIHRRRLWKMYAQIRMMWWFRKVKIKIISLSKITDERTHHYLEQRGSNRGNPISTHSLYNVRK